SRQLAAAITTGDTGAARSDARAAVELVAKRFLEPDAELGSEPLPPTHAPAVGERVIVGGLGLEAIVTAVHDGTADLDVRGKRMRASVRDLRVIAGAPTAPARVNVSVELQPRDGTMADLN